MKKKRLKKNKQRAMEKHNSLPPMSTEQKEAQKKNSAIDRARTKAVLDKTKNK